MPTQDKPPWMSLGHSPLLRASATVRVLRILGGTHAKTVAARFSIEQPCSKRSVQKKSDILHKNFNKTTGQSWCKKRQMSYNLGWIEYMPLNYVC